MSRPLLPTPDACQAPGCSLPYGHSRRDVVEALLPVPAAPAEDVASKSLVDLALEPGATLIPAALVADYLASDEKPSYFLLVPVPDRALTEEAVFDLLPPDSWVVCSVCGVDVLKGEVRLEPDGSRVCEADQAREPGDPDERIDR